MSMFSTIEEGTVMEDKASIVEAKRDFSNVVTHLNSGKLIIDRAALAQTEKFQKNLAILNRIAERYHNSKKA